MTRAKRSDVGAAAAGLFARASATGGLATRERAPVTMTRAGALVGQRLRQGVELLVADVDFLRDLSRPARTGQPRTLGSKFVATGVLTAAIQVLRAGEIDMYGVEAGDLETMTARAHEALMRAGTRSAAP